MKKCKVKVQREDYGTWFGGSYTYSKQNPIIKIQTRSYFRISFWGINKTFYERYTTVLKNNVLINAVDIITQDEKMRKRLK